MGGGRRNKPHSAQAEPLILPSGQVSALGHSPAWQSLPRVPSDPRARRSGAYRCEIHTDPPGPRTHTHSPVTTRSRQHPQSRSPGGGRGRSKAESLLEKTESSDTEEGGDDREEETGTQARSPSAGARSHRHPPGEESEPAPQQPAESSAGSAHTRRPAGHRTPRRPRSPFRRRRGAAPAPRGQGPPANAGRRRGGDRYPLRSRAAPTWPPPSAPVSRPPASGTTPFLPPSLSPPQAARAQTWPLPGRLSPAPPGGTGKRLEGPSGPRRPHTDAPSAPGPAPPLPPQPPPARGRRAARRLIKAQRPAARRPLAAGEGKEGT